MKNGSGVARALINNKEFAIWLQATAKRRICLISLRLVQLPAGRLATESAQKPQATLFHITINYFESQVGRISLDRLSCHYVTPDCLFARIIDVLLLETSGSKFHD